MHESSPKRILRIALFLAILIFVSGLLVMGLWNWLMPSLFALRRISFPEALGLLLLGRILFGGLGGRRHYRRWRMRQRWAQMTPEECEHWRQKRSERLKAP